MPIADILIYTILLLGAVGAYAAKKLTLAASITGFIVGLLVYKGAGFTGIALLAFFFMTGTFATGWKHAQKRALGLPQDEKGSRTAGQVLANGGIAALCGALGWYSPNLSGILPLMMAGSLAAATADTLSSELGTLYGSRFINVLTFKPDRRGLDGVISLEGTLIGAGGAAFIALIYAIGFGWALNLYQIVLAGIIGNYVDSVLGATLERKAAIGNNVVNLLNTLIGALVCLLLSGI